MSQNADIIQILEPDARWRHGSLQFSVFATLGGRACLISAFATRTTGLRQDGTPDILSGQNIPGVK